MTQNNKKNRGPADAKAAKPPVPATAPATKLPDNGKPSVANPDAAVKPPVAAPDNGVPKAVPDTGKGNQDGEAQEVRGPHFLDSAMDAFVAACADYVADSQSPRSTVVGPYRIAFNGPQLISVVHN